MESPVLRIESHKNKETRACVIDFLSCISYTGVSYPDWVALEYTPEFRARRWRCEILERSRNFY